MHVTVENTTYADGSFYQNGGAFVEAEVELYSDTTMMTAVLEALSENGYGWNNGMTGASLTSKTSIKM